MAKQTLNREAWLNRMADMLRPWFRDHGYPIHGRLSVTMTRLPNGTLGLCNMNHAADGIVHVAVTAYEDGHMTDTINVVAVLAHEICHAILPPNSKHGKAWRECCAAIGLRGSGKRYGEADDSVKPTAKDTWAGTQFRAFIIRLLEHMPPLPRYGLTTPIKPAVIGGHKNGAFTFQCEACKTTLQIRFTSLERAGTPPCWNEECDSYGEEMEMTKGEIEADG